MDFSKLSSNEKLATYGAVAVIVGGLVGIGTAGLGIVSVLAAVGMLAVIFLPQLSPGTNLPGSRGSLMLLLGGIAAVILVLGLLSVIGAIGLLMQYAIFNTLFYLIAVAGGVLMAWAGWQEFQGEGGKFQLGAAPSSVGTARPTSTEPSVDARADAAPDADAAPEVGAGADAAPGFETTPPAEPPAPHDREDRPTV